MWRADRGFLTEGIVNEGKRIENEEEKASCRNEATEEEKCFIIHSDPSYSSAVAKNESEECFDNEKHFQRAVL